MSKINVNNTSAMDIGTLSLDLFDAPDILRGNVCTTDFETSIFPLLFVKQRREPPMYNEERTVEQIVFYTLCGNTSSHVLLLLEGVE